MARNVVIKIRADDLDAIEAKAKRPPSNLLLARN